MQKFELILYRHYCDRMGNLNYSSKKNTYENKISLVDEAIQKIRDAILFRKLHLKERLVAASLADQLKMSRTPIRDWTRICRIQRENQA